LIDGKIDIKSNYMYNDNIIMIITTCNKLNYQ